MALVYLVYYLGGSSIPWWCLVIIERSWSCSWWHSWGPWWRQDTSRHQGPRSKKFQGKGIFILVFTQIHRCMLALYTQYFPESCEKKSQAYYLGGIRTHDPCNSRAVSCQLDYRGCPVARGSLNPVLVRVVPHISASRSNLLNYHLHVTQGFTMSKCIP